APEPTPTVKPRQTHHHPPGRPGLLPVVPDQVQDVRVDVVGPPGVEQDVAAPGHLVERPGEGRPVQEADLVGQLDVQHVAAQVLLHDPPDRPPDVAPGDE